MNRYNCKTPIVFIFFNRIEPMTKVLDRIRQVRPRTLYFISDGPRNEEEKIKVTACRKAAERSVDWDCDLITNYAEKNMGCKYRVYSGISYALEREDSVIILEDDCLPSISFFRFQDEMLERYKDSQRVMMVSGYNILSSTYHNSQDYVFTRFPSIWGWGTWRRAWEKIDIELSEWKERRKNFKVRPLSFRYVLKRQYDQIYFGGFDTWDYQWRYARNKYQGIGVAPVKSLIRNIGFSEEATHTKKAGQYGEVKECEIIFPIKYQDVVEPDLEYDRLYRKKFYEKGFFKSWIKDMLKKGLHFMHIGKKKYGDDK